MKCRRCGWTRGVGGRRMKQSYCVQNQMCNHKEIVARHSFYLYGRYKLLALLYLQMINGRMRLAKLSFVRLWLLQLKFVQFPNSFNSRFVYATNCHYYSSRTYKRANHLQGHIQTIEIEWE